MIRKLTTDQLRALRSDLERKTKAFEDQWGELSEERLAGALMAKSSDRRQLLDAKHREEERFKLLVKVQNELQRRGAL